MQNLEQKTLCSYPWVHIKHKANSSLEPCCNYTGSSFSLKESQSFHHALVGTEMESIRSQMRRGVRPSGCSACFKRESSEGWSLRQEANSTFPQAWERPPELKYLEFNFGNLCNLRCLGCDSQHSTKWVRYEEERGRDPALIARPVRTSLSQLDGAWQTLTHVKLIGGEPLLFPEHEDFLKRLNENANVEKVNLRYTTNGTIRVSDSVLSVWKRLKHLHLIFSVDGLREGNDFFREGSRWQEILDNVKWFQTQLAGTNTSFGFHTVVNVHNIQELKELDLWLLGEFPNFGISKDCLVEPKELSITQLPQAERSILSAKYKVLSHEPGLPAFLREGYAYVAATIF